MIDLDKVFYIEQLFLMLSLALRYFFDKLPIECLLVFKYMLRLSTSVPDHRLTIALFKQQGMLHSYMANYVGAVKSF